MDINSSNAQLNSNDTHPVPAIRLGTTLIAMTKLLDHPFKISQQQAISSFITAYTEVKDFWSILRLPARTFENDFIKIIEKSGELLSRESTINAELGKFIDQRLQRFGTSLAYYNQFKSFYEKKN